MLYHHILDRICVERPKLSNFKIGGQFYKIVKIGGTKTAIKPSIINDYFYESKSYCIISIFYDRSFNCL
jgi:hypothetical protein